jgi:two-component system nitrate/nitrite sensor histidine kinase NarX
VSTSGPIPADPIRPGPYGAGRLGAALGRASSVLAGVAHDHLAAALTMLAVSVAYYAGATVGFGLTFASEATSIFWLPNATMFAVFLLAPPRRWWLYVLAALPAHVAIQAHHNVPPLAMLLLFVTNLGDGALAAAAVRRWKGTRSGFDTFRGMCVFLAAASLSPFLVSFLDAGVKVATGWVPDYWVVWRTRVCSNVLTNIIWVPPVVIAATRGARWVLGHSARRYLEAGLLALTLLGVGTAVFGVRIELGTEIAILFTPLPLFLWAAVRFGTGGVTAALLAFAFLVIRQAVAGHGPFAGASPQTTILTLQIFLSLLGAPLLLLAALLQERRRVEAALRDREAQYRSIFEATSDGMLITDLDNGVVAANPAFQELTGYGAADLGAAHPRTFLHLDDLRSFDTYLARAGAGDVTETRAMCVRPDGGLARFELRGRRFSHGVVSLVRDVTERDRAFDLLERRVADRTRVLSTLLETSAMLASTLELRPLLRLVLEQLEALVGHTGATVFIQEDDALVVLDHRGPLAPSAVSELRVPATSLADSTVFNRDSPFIVDDLRGDSPAARAFRASTPETVTRLFGYARSVMTVPLKARDRTIGLLRIDSDEPGRFTLQDAQLAWALANQAAVAIENARLYDQARELAAFEERQRLARELHDSVTQTLYAFAMLGEMLPGTWERDPEQGRRSLANLREMTRTALAEMRMLLLELRPAALLQAGLGDLLRQLAEALRSRTEVPIHVTVEGAVNLPSDAHVAFYQAAREALVNIIRHASAAGVWISLRGSGDGATLSVVDDGVGFDPERVAPDGSGLGIVRRRAEAAGVALTIDSAEGKGTSVKLRFPQKENSS